MCNRNEPKLTRKNEKIKCLQKRILKMQKKCYDLIEENNMLKGKNTTVCQ